MEKKNVNKNERIYNCIGRSATRHSQFTLVQSGREKQSTVTLTLSYERQHVIFLEIKAVSEADVFKF